MLETEIAIESGGVRLAGALTTPEATGPWPVVLCLHGTGPQDRNENIPNQTLDVFNAVAARLAGVGVACLRFDKRGAGASGGDYYRAGQSEFLADAAAWIDWLAAEGRFAETFALGHSEGTLLAARLGLIRPLDGLVLLSPFVQRIEPILMAQAAEIETMLRETPGLPGLLNRLVIALGLGPVRGQSRLIRRLGTSTAPTFGHFGQPIPAKSLRELMAIDPARVYAEIRIPTLIIGGGKDLQCDPADVAAIASLVGNTAEPVVMPNLMHFLRQDTEPASFRRYEAMLREPMDIEVLDLVANWVRDTAGR